MSHSLSISTSRVKLKTTFTASVELVAPTKRELPTGKSFNKDKNSQRISV